MSWYFFNSNIFQQFSYFHNRYWGITIRKIGKKNSYIFKNILHIPFSSFNHLEKVYRFSKLETENCKIHNLCTELRIEKRTDNFGFFSFHVQYYWRTLYIPIDYHFLLFIFIHLFICFLLPPLFLSLTSVSLSLLFSSFPIFFVSLSSSVSLLYFLLSLCSRLSYPPLSPLSPPHESFFLSDCCRLTSLTLFCRLSVSSFSYYLSLSSLTYIYLLRCLSLYLLSPLSSHFSMAIYSSCHLPLSFPWPVSPPSSSYSPLSTYFFF